MNENKEKEINEENTLLHYRKPRESDIEQIVEIHRSAITEIGNTFYTDRQIDAWAAEARPDSYPINDSASLFILVESKDTILGISQLNLDKPELAKLFIKPEVAGNGIGEKLLKQMETYAIERGINELFLDSSLNATDFYYKNGYNYDTMLNKHLSTDDGEEVVYPTLRMRKSF
jgi:putative acetyltransferase